MWDTYKSDTRTFSILLAFDFPFISPEYPLIELNKPDIYYKAVPQVNKIAQMYM